MSTGVSGVPLTIEQARRLAAGIMAAADNLAAICPNPDHLYLYEI